MNREQAIDLMRDVYLTKAQREAYEYILSLALPEYAEAVAVVDANDDGYFAEILPDREVKIGQNLYPHPPKDDAERGALLERIDGIKSIYVNLEMLPEINDLLRDIRAYLTRLFKRRCVMGVREQIMDLAIPDPLGESERQYNDALIQAADIAEARERELLAERARMIAEIRAVVKCAETATDGDTGDTIYIGEAYPEGDIEAIISKCEVKG